MAIRYLSSETSCIRRERDVNHLPELTRTNVCQQQIFYRDGMRLRIKATVTAMVMVANGQGDHGYIKSHTEWKRNEDMINKQRIIPLNSSWYVLNATGPFRGIHRRQFT